MSQSDVLFEIRQEHLESGLRGFPVGLCTTSDVHPQRGLSYRGIPIAELAQQDPEDVIFLLNRGHLPNSEEKTDFRRQMIAHSSLHPGVLSQLRNLPREAHPMKWFCSGILAMGMYSPTDDYRQAALDLTAQIPELVAAIYRIRSGWGDPIASQPELGYMENFVHMLGIKTDREESLRYLLRVFDILHFDHGGGNLSTFVGKAIASGQEDLFGSISGAMAALAGPLHGMANQECLRFLKEVLQEIGDPDDTEALRTYCKKRLDDGGKLFGFGHAVLRVEDPRATVQYEVGEKIAQHEPLFRLALNLRTVGTEILKGIPKVSNPYPNVDAVSGSLLCANGLLDETYYTVLFGMSRAVGIAAQIVYERTEARGGKGTPIVRPKYIYAGSSR